MNKVILIGNLTKDPDVHTTQTNVKKASFVLAIDRRYTNQQGNKEADFIPVVAWRERAEFVEKFLTKGKKVSVIGALQSRSYNTQDGGNRTVLEVVADEFEFVTAKVEGERQKETAQPMTPADDDPDLPF